MRWAIVLVKLYKKSRHPCLHLVLPSHLHLCWRSVQCPPANVNCHARDIITYSRSCLVKYYCSSFFQNHVFSAALIIREIAFYSLSTYLSRMTTSGQRLYKSYQMLLYIQFSLSWPNDSLELTSVTLMTGSHTNCVSWKKRRQQSTCACIGNDLGTWGLCNTDVYCLFIWFQPCSE